MNRTVHFADKSVLFVPEPVAGAALLRPRTIAEIDRANIAKILETNNSAAVIWADPDAAFARFAEAFVAVTAAGGVVVDAQGRRLLIRRNGRWDLPKGHLEAGETLEQCAAREVCEETGVGARTERLLCDTYHAYNLYGKWELKRTWWYLLRTDASAVPAPQREEGITEAVWVPAGEFDARIATAYPTIRRVGAALAELLKNQ